MGDPTPSVLLRAVVNPRPCGVADYSDLLTDRLRARGLRVARDLHEDHAGSWRDEIALGRRVRADFREAVLLFQYASFGNTYRGVPAGGFLLPLRARLRGKVVVSVLHELWPTFSGAPRGRLLSVLHRVATVAVIVGSHEVVVTTEERARSVRIATAGLRRPRVLPVFSNWPSRTWEARDGSAQDRVAVCVPGWGHPRIPKNLIAAAAAQAGVTLVMLGGNPDSPAAVEWRSSLRRFKTEHEFTGFLSASNASARLAACHATLIPSSDGPTASKGTVAAALQNGVPTIGFDGPHTWSELRSGAVLLVDEDQNALARALGGLGSGSALRDAAAEGKRFYDRRMSVELVAAEMESIIRRRLAPARMRSLGVR